MPDQLHPDQQADLTERRAAQDRLWRDAMCRLALAVKRMWTFIGESLNLTEDAVHAITNLAKMSGDNTVSISELAEISDLTPERAAAAIDALLKRGMAVRAVPRDGEPVQDRRVRLRGELVGMIFEYYRLQPEHREQLDQFTADEINLGERLLEVAASAANGQARAIHTGQINPGAHIKQLLG